MKLKGRRSPGVNSNSLLRRSLVRLLTRPLLSNTQAIAEEISPYSCSPGRNTFTLPELGSFFVSYVAGSNPFPITVGCLVLPISSINDFLIRPMSTYFSLKSVFHLSDSSTSFFESAHPSIESR